MVNYNLSIVVVRSGTAGTERLSMKAIDTGDMFCLPVDADIQEGDRVEQVIPSGRTRTLYITKVDVLQSPFGSSSLNHTEAHYAIADPSVAASAGSSTLNVHATNIQVATGQRINQTMNVGPTAEDVALLIKGIAELAVMIGLVDPGDAELCEMRDEALKCVDDANPDVGPVGRFVTWMGERVKDGSNAAVAAVIAAVVSGLVSDAETLAHALGH